MGRQRQRKHQIDGLITLVLFGVFAGCVLSVLLTGAKVYRDLTAEGQAAYGRRICAQYIATKVRQVPSGSALRVETSDGIDILSYSEEIGGETYITSVYCSDGWVRELFTFEGAEFLPEDGERIVEAEQVRFSLEDGLLRVEIEGADGSGTELALALRGGAGA